MSEIRNEDVVRTAPRRGPEGLLGLLWNHNPFYVVSAALVLWGVHKGIAAGDGGMGATLILGILVCYSLALGEAAVLIVRLGRVWEDARTVLLLMVLLFLAASVLFDELLLADPATGRRLLGVCLLTAILVSEAVLRAILWGVLFLALGLALSLVKGRGRAPPQTASESQLTEAPAGG